MTCSEAHQSRNQFKAQCSSVSATLRQIVQQGKVDVCKTTAIAGLPPAAEQCVQHILFALLGQPEAWMPKHGPSPEQPTSGGRRSLKSIGTEALQVAAGCANGAGQLKENSRVAVSRRSWKAYQCKYFPA